MKYILIILVLSLSCLPANARSIPPLILDIPDETIALPGKGELPVPEKQLQDIEDKRIKTERPKNLFWGLNAGYIYSYNNWVSRDSYGAEANMRDIIYGRHGFTVGLSASRVIDQVFSFDFGISISRMGFRYEPNPSMVIDVANYSMEFPAIITFCERDATRWFAQVGFLFGVTLGGYHNINNSQLENWNNDTSYNLLSKVTVGIICGIGYGPVALQYYANLTPTLSTRFINDWERASGLINVSEGARGVRVSYTYWF